MVEALKIWSHNRRNLINDATITTYCLSPLKFVYEHASRNADYSHNLACDDQVLKIFGKGNS